METKKQQLQKVRPEDFDTDALLRAAREGRLFIQPVCHEQPLTDVLDYVERIRKYATNTHVREIWEAILNHEQLAPLFRFNRYAATRGQINWYRVTAMVCLLREKGVYRQDMTAVQLHLHLEGTTCRTTLYTGMSRYLLERRELSAVRQILDKFSL